MSIVILSAGGRSFVRLYTHTMLKKKRGKQEDMLFSTAQPL
jgi:hypothetical protein